MQVFTDHKNLAYFHQPQALNHQQACWLLNLTDFNLKMIHVPRKLLARPDALSRRPNLLPSDDTNNDGVTLLPLSLFVNLIDTALSQCIESTSAGDPLILQVLQSIHEDIPLPFRSRLADWQVELEMLTYKGHVYCTSPLMIPSAILSSNAAMIMSQPATLAF